MYCQKKFLFSSDLWFVFIIIFEGCLVLPGAQPALGGTPGMMGYGMAKAAIHQLTKSLASADSGLPNDAKTFALLPITLGEII